MTQGQITTVDITLALTTLVLGLCAAYYWTKASNVNAPLPRVESGDAFSRKVARFIAVLESISEEHAEQEVKFGVDIIIGLLREAKTLASKRNEYVHAVVVDDFGLRKARLRLRKREDRVCDWGAIFALMGRFQNLTWDIDYHAYELALTLASRRRSREKQAEE